MRTFSSPSLGMLFLSAVCFVACEKETFDVITMEVEPPSPDAIAAVDCPALMLNVGDACELNSTEGVVSSECECVTSDSAELIVMEFINDFSEELVLTVETDPSFLAGSTYVVVPPLGEDCIVLPPKWSYFVFDHRLFRLLR